LEVYLKILSKDPWIWMV